MGTYKVYVLYHGGIVVYVGCTCNIYRRIIQHERDKDFDSYRIQFHSDNKEEALFCEKSIINFLIDTYNRPMYNRQQSTIMSNNQLVKL